MVGEKRHLLTLQTRSDALDSFGDDSSPTYADLATAWGKVEAVSSQEKFESDQTQNNVSHRITLRHDSLYSGLRAQDRIVYGSRIFDIVTPIDKTGRGRELTILALERF
jgi:SPP1 family predicted phage head-tail adaptor